jgi:Asp-tRNA(Asn)/Glu-tRNA(Gln) amidotransferase A subunit family amidase
VLRAEGLPLGLQLIGFADSDAALFAAAASVLELFPD